jgi:Bacteriophage T4-like capsid assembly protein (Gp20).
MLRERINLAREVRDYIGKFYSVGYVRRNILKQSETDIKKMDAEIKKKLQTALYHHRLHKLRMMKLYKE